MAWCKLESSFRDHRKFKRMAADLDIPDAHARGLMAGLWSWAVDQAADGDLGDHTPLEIEAAMDWKGKPGKAYETAVKHNLISCGNGSCRLYGWMERAGAYRNAQRLQRHRKMKRIRNVAGVQAVTLRGEEIEERRRDRGEEKRGEESLAWSSIAVSLPLVGKQGEHPVHEDEIKAWCESFPGVDVLQQLRAMREWLLSNPTKRKTARGIRKFVTSWLSREQDKPKPGNGNGKHNDDRNGRFARVTQKAMEWANAADEQSGIRGFDVEVEGALPEPSDR